MAGLILSGFLGLILRGLKNAIFSRSFRSFWEDFTGLLGEGSFLWLFFCFVLPGQWLATAYDGGL